MSNSTSLLYYMCSCYYIVSTGRAVGETDVSWKQGLVVYLVSPGTSILVLIPSTGSPVYIIIQGPSTDSLDLLPPERSGIDS